MTTRKVLLFFLVMMTVGCGFAIAATFLFLYLQACPPLHATRHQHTMAMCIRSHHCSNSPMCVVKKPHQQPLMGPMGYRGLLMVGACKPLRPHVGCLSQELGASQTLLGLTVAFTVSSEIPLFFFTSALMKVEPRCPLS